MIPKKILNCELCNHRWMTRLDYKRYPKACPKCYKYNWNTKMLAKEHLRNKLLQSLGV